MINFADEHLMAKYGSWIRVQVAFYDFLFQKALNLCPEHFRQQAVDEAILEGKFRDGENFYERCIRTIELTFSTQDEAWKAFVDDL